MRDICAPAALAKELDFRMVASSARVRTDPDMVLTILINLVGNAIKYTDRGRVLVGCRRRAGRLIIEVHDTGVGIAADHLPAIFEEFRRVEPQRRAGYGLGLSIVRQSVELLGHRVRVRSTVGRGSCFAIELPLLGASGTAVGGSPALSVAAS
ncbi:MAG: hypothetical protein HY060_19535 [Proteobacteria bacterium]|nr:hypothetical protein [Pseudomonadota bacterium]